MDKVSTCCVCGQERLGVSFINSSAVVAFQCVFCLSQAMKEMSNRAGELREYCLGMCREHGVVSMSCAKVERVTDE